MSPRIRRWGFGLAIAAVLGTGAAVAVWCRVDRSRHARESVPADTDPRRSVQWFFAAMSTPSEEGIANNSGVRCATQGHYEEAIIHFREAVSLNESYLPGYKNLLAACIELQRWQEAREAAVTAEELHPLAVEIGRERPPEDQEKRRMLRADRDFIANLGKAYLETGDLEKAEKRYGLQLHLFPMDLRGLNGLAEVAFRQRDYERAVQLFAQSLKLYGRQPEVKARLEEVKEQAPELADRVRWVLESYADAARATPSRQPWTPPGWPEYGPVVPSPVPAVPRPKSPIPEVEQP